MRGTGINTTNTATVKSPVDVQESYRYCEQMVRSHYENFPVASVFLPAEKRPHLAAIYAFARTADDIADEGVATPEERLHRLDQLHRGLEMCYSGIPEGPVFTALAETVRTCNIPSTLFEDLLSAFRMDVTIRSFATFDDLLAYCRRSANPVGRLVLHVFDVATDQNMRDADFICSALQLTNFWQDVAVDREKGRMYLPLEDCDRFGYHESDLRRDCVDDRFRHLMKFQVERTRTMFTRGRTLCTRSTPGLGFHLKLTWLGGMTILKKIERIGYDVLHQRPVLSFTDKFGLAGRAIVFSQVP